MHPVAMNLTVRVHESRVHGLMPFFMKSVGEMLRAHPEFAVLNSVLDRGWWRSRIVVFDDLAFSIAVEKPFEGENVVAIYVLRDVMRRGLDEIAAEYTALKAMPIEELPLFRKMRWLLSVPDFFHLPLFKLAALFPRDYDSYGSMGLSNLGRGHIQTFFPSTSKTCIFGLGGVIERDGHHELTVNLVFNHFVVDGALCARFLEALKTRLELG